MSSTFFQNAAIASLALIGLPVAMDARAATAPTPPVATAAAASAVRPTVRHVHPSVDRSGRRRVGKASVYASKFEGRQMADGTRMDPQDDNAASKTLPLGSTAKVTNLQTGQSAVVTIRDRGPHVPGRIVDLSPATADKVGIDRRQGVARVAVTPIALPPPDAAAKGGDASPVAKRDAQRDPAADDRPAHTPPR